MVTCSVVHPVKCQRRATGIDTIKHWLACTAMTKSVQTIITCTPHLIAYLLYMTIHISIIELLTHNVLVLLVLKHIPQ